MRVEVELCAMCAAHLEEVGSGCLVEEQVVGCDAVEVLLNMLLEDGEDVLQPCLVAGVMCSVHQ